MIDAKELVVRPASAGDLPACCALMKELGLNWPDPRDAQAMEAAIDALWSRNPCVLEADEAARYGYLMEHHNKVVGFFGNVPSRYLMNGKPVLASVATAWGIKKEYRAHKQLLADGYFVANPLALKLVTTASARAGLMYLHYGGSYAPLKRLDEVYVVPFRLGQLLALSLPAALKPLAALLNLLPLWRMGAGAAPKAIVNEFTLDSFPDDYDTFWAEAAANAKGLIAWRDAATIRWAYGASRRNTPKRFFVLREHADGPIVAYAVILRETIARDASFNRWKVSDLLALSGSHRSTLLRTLIHMLASSGCDALEFHVPGTLEQKDIPAFTLKRRTRAFPVLYQGAVGASATYLAEPRNWTITPFDGDTPYA